MIENKYNLTKIKDLQHPCKTAKSINDPYRSTKYKWEPKHAAKCDNNLVEGWYRFTSIVGGQMPTTKPEPFYCGTVAPIWIRDTHPTPKDPEKTVTACTNVHNTNNGCRLKSTISVKNCGKFFVYKLKPTLGCPMAYCAGDKKPCPIGQVGIVPNCKVSKIVDFPFGLVPLPIVTYRKIPINPITMLCKFKFHAPLKNVAFAVEWFVDGHLVKKETICANEEDLNCANRQSALPARDKEGRTYFQPGHRVRCKLRMKYNTNILNKWTRLGRDSNEYFVGIEVTVSPNHGRLKECNEDTKITVKFRPTIPIVGNPVSVKILVPKAISQVAVTTCDLSLSGSQTRSIEIKALCDNLNQNNGAMQYHFVITDFFHQFWNLYKLPSIKVTIENTEQKECKSTGDPHYYTFDMNPSYYNYFPIGDNVLYRNTFTDTEVQTRTWLCGRRANGPTCNCGVAIREGADIMIFNACNQQLVHAPGILRTQIRSKRGLAPGTHIFRQILGSTVKINVILPSGTRVKVDRYNWGLNIFVKAFKIKPGSIYGLCGNFNGNRNDEFQNGGDKKNHGNNANSFGNSWRVPSGESYFEKFIPNPPALPDKEWCQCPSKLILKFTACINADNLYQNYGKTPGKDIAKQFKPGKGKRRSITETTYTDDHILDNEDKSFFVDEHDAYFASTRIRARREVLQEFMSKENATQLCKRSIEDSTAGKTCKKVPGFDITASILECVTDLQLTGDVKFASAAFDSMKESCEDVSLKNVSLYKKDANGKLKPPAEIGDNLCPSDCSNHGNCTNRTCICEEGYTSNDCSMSINAVPELFGIYDGGLCDIRRRPCKKTDIFGQDFIDSENLTCHSWEFKVFPSNWVIKPTATKLPGEMFDIFGVRCELPDPPTKLGDYDSEGTPAGGLWISISNDGKRRSQQQMRFVSYDSVCIACNKTGNCSLKENSCLIRGHCFAANQTNPRDWCQQCMPGNNQHTWTQRKDNRPPSFDKNQTTRFAVVGEYLPLQLKASDPDNRPVKYSLISSTASSVYTFTPSGLLKWNVTSRDNKEFTFKVTDECNATDVITITIRILVCPCNNGGKCLPHPSYPRGSGQYSCQCPKGFTGDKCQPPTTTRQPTTTTQPPTTTRQPTTTTQPPTTTRQPTTTQPPTTTRQPTTNQPPTTTRQPTTTTQPPTTTKQPTTTTQPPTTTRQPTTTTQQNFCIGKENCNHADPMNCNGYIECSNGIPYYMSCPDGLVWSDNERICNYKGHENPPCPTPHPNPTRTTTTKPPGNLCSGRKNGNYPDPKNCNGYIACSYGHPYHMPCPAGLVWSDKQGICNHKGQEDPPCNK